MTKLATIFLATTIVSVGTAIILGFAAIQEAKMSNVFSQRSYLNGLRDGESFTRSQILKAEIEREIIEEAEQHVAEEKL